MKGEPGAIRSIIDELHSSGLQGNQFEDESRFTRSIIDEIHSSNGR